MHTPPVDLFAIEHTNRDSRIHPGEDRIKGTADDVALRSRFNADPAWISAGQEINAPESYGSDAVSGRLPSAQSRGIATLPGGVPLFRDTNADGLGDTLVGGIGVFFPGPDGYATHEQGFVAGAGQTALDRINAARVLEAEFIAFAAAGGSLSAERMGAAGAKVGDLDGIAPVADLDLPFGRLDLVGIQLEVVGPIAGIEGPRQLIAFGTNLGGGSVNGTDQPIDRGIDLVPLSGDEAFARDGESVPDGWLVEPHAGVGLTKADVEQIVDQAILEAQQVRAAIRLPISSRTRMVLAVTDTTGEVLGLYRMTDATFFSLDVAVAKARNTSYYADAAALDAVDAVAAPGVAFTNRTFRFLAEPRYPSGVDGSTPPPFSILNHASIDAATGENVGAPAAASSFDATVDPANGSVLGFDAFFPQTNFHDAGDSSVVADPSNLAATDVRKANQNGVIFFPGSTPLYKDGVLVGGLGVSGDGVDQDDVVTFSAAAGFLPPAGVTRADQIHLDGVRLPYIKLLRNPRG
jgi:uncharacterized protein GlcG (DUF336 family)